MDSSSTESDSMSDYEMNEPPPPAVMDADEEEILSAPQNTMRGKEPITFDKVKFDLLRNQSVPVEALSVRARKEEVEFPPELKSHNAYKEGDWKAFIDTGVDGDRRDWSFKHRVYQRTFRSKPDVEEFLDTNGPVTGRFRGTNLHKKKITGLYRQRSTGTRKSTTGKKAAKYAKDNVSVGSGPSIWPYPSHGFV